MGRGSRKKALKRAREERAAPAREAAEAMRESVAERVVALQRRRDEGDLGDEEMEAECEKLAAHLRLAGDADVVAAAVVARGQR